jgi:hypothetical protein
VAQSTTSRLRSQLHRLQNPTAPQPELGLEDVLPKATIIQILKEEEGIWKSILYTPWVTFWTFFWQMLSPDRSCRSALKRLAAWMGLHGQKLDDEDTSPYCKARARLPESALRRLMRWLGAKSHQGVPRNWRWCGRRVKVVDGSTTIMADTAANQRAYPQSRSQKPGLGVSDRFRGYHFLGEMGTTCDTRVTHSRRPKRPQPTGVGRLGRREHVLRGWVRPAETMVPFLTETDTPGQASGCPTGGMPSGSPGCRA